MHSIQKLTVAGFRSLRSITLTPGPITVLIGPNGSGKSNLLAVFRLLSAIRSGALALHVAKEGGASALLHRGGKVTDRIYIELVLVDRWIHTAYVASLGPVAGDRLVFLDEHTAQTGPPDGEWDSDWLKSGHAESRMSQAPPGSVAQSVARAIGSVAFYHFHDTSPSSALRANARALEHYSLLSDGRNLAAYLLGLSQGRDDASRASWTLLTALVRQVAPFVSQLEPTPVNADPAMFRLDDPNGSIDKVTVRLDWIDDQGDRYGVHQLSDGTLRAIALFAALTQPGSRLPAFISIDEPELGLHPAAVAVLVELIRSVSDRCQVLLATQSPSLLDHFAAEEVVVAERVQGATELRSLDAGGLSVWLEDYSLGELFDKNVLGGRP